MGFSTVLVEQYSSRLGVPGACKVRAACAKIWHAGAMLDATDYRLLNLVQRDGWRTAEQLAADVPLSPSAIARRLRRLRAQGWIARTLSLVSSRLTSRRLRALVMVQLSEHADRTGKQELVARLLATDAVQFCYELAGPNDLALLFDCAHVEELVETVERVLVPDPTVRRYETLFVKKEIKFAPYVPLGAPGSAGEAADQ
jgi:Lrp/AsnC family transcriptional regulator, leucine-responsive regulatory protein